MAEHQHFSHPHFLKYHKFGLEGATITCTGCKFPCTDKPIYSCRACKFYLHEQCFDATRSLSHSLHPAHPLSLFPSSTYESGSFICSSCNKSGSGFCFCCTTCEFDLHIHCAYNNSNSNSNNNNNNNDFKQKAGTSRPPNKIQIKAHPNHPLYYRSKPPTCGPGDSYSCDVCGTDCDPNSPTYRCETCNYDVHVGCASLPETDKREDHPHTLSLLHVNPYESFECDVCRGTILQKHCMYICPSNCDYGMHVKCVSAKVTEKAPMNDMQFQVEMFKLQNQMKVHQMMIDTKLMVSVGIIIIVTIVTNL